MATIEFVENEALGFINQVSPTKEQVNFMVNDLNVKYPTSRMRLDDTSDSDETQGWDDKHITERKRKKVDFVSEKKTMHK